MKNENIDYLYELDDDRGNLLTHNTSSNIFMMNSPVECAATAVITFAKI